MATIPSTGQVSFGDLNEAIGLSRTSQRNSNDTTLRKFHDTSTSTTIKLSDFRNRSYFIVTQTGNQTAVNLKSVITYNVNGGVWPTGPVIANYIINSGVTLTGSGVLSGFSTGQNWVTSWPTGSKVYMTNGGTIQGDTGATGSPGASGAGGSGGNGGVNDAGGGGTGATGQTGATGGIAAEFTVTSIVTNNGSILGGVGGNGGTGGTGGGGGGGSAIGVYAGGGD